MNQPALAIRTRSGAVVNVPATLRVISTYVLLEQEEWFESEVDFVRRLLQPGEIAVDVGANFGAYTVAMAAAVGPTGRVVAFEPAATTCAFLRATVQATPQVEVVQAAVSDRTTRAAFRTGAMPELNALASTDAPADATEMVEVVDFDSWFAPRTGRIALLKLDAEGHELQVGRGARQTLLRDEPILLFEVSVDNKVDLGLLAFLESLGFSAYRLLPGLGLLAPVSRGEPLDASVLNLFALSPAKAALLHQRGLLATTTATGVKPAGAIDGSLQPLVAYSPDRRPQTEIYRDALLHHARAHAPALDPNARLAHALDSLRCARAALAERPSVARLITLVRVAQDVGCRAEAANHLLASRAEFLRVAAVDCEEACLAPSSRSPPIGPAAESPVRLRTAVLEAYERCRAHSSLYTGTQSIPWLEQLAALPFSTPEMHRRRQLLKLWHGQQPAPEFDPVLAVAGPENLNAWFWQVKP